MSRLLVLAQFTSVIVVAGLVVWLFVWQNTLTQSLNPLPTSLIPRPRPAFQTSLLPSSSSTWILYLLQTEECLPSHLKSVFVNSSACPCDVVVLSYKKVCTDTSLSNVKYLFNRSTTWTTGRNLLFYSNMYHRSKRYLYYILMDDDIHLQWTEKLAKEFRSKDPWRSFEEFLYRVQPAVAALRVNNQTVFGPERCLVGKEYSPTVWYDAAFNAFHYKAVEHLLPYSDHFDNISWWYSQLYNIVWSEIVFRGQVVMNREIIAVNKVHHSYPRKRMFDSALAMILKDIRERIPENCQNASLIQEWERNNISHAQMGSSTYCLPPPLPNYTVTAYRNFIC